MRGCILENELKDSENDLLKKAIELKLPALLIPILDQDYNLALRRAAAGNIASIFDSLLKRVTNINHPGQITGKNALHVAAGSGFDSIVLKLLDAGAYIDMLDKESNSPYSLAHRNLHASTARLLLSKGATASYQYPSVLKDTPAREALFYKLINEGAYRHQDPLISRALDFRLKELEGSQYAWLLKADQCLLVFDSSKDTVDKKDEKNGQDNSLFDDINYKQIKQNSRDALFDNTDKTRILKDLICRPTSNVKHLDLEALNKLSKEYFIPHYPDWMTKYYSFHYNPSDFLITGMAKSVVKKLYQLMDDIVALEKSLNVQFGIYFPNPKKEHFFIKAERTENMESNLHDSFCTSLYTLTSKVILIDSDNITKTKEKIESSVLADRVNQLKFP